MDLHIEAHGLRGEAAVRASLVPRFSASAAVLRSKDEDDREDERKMSFHAHGGLPGDAAPFNAPPHHAIYRLDGRE